jgi:hypothetical protein
MGLFERFRARRAIKAYARRLPQLLHKDYGGADAYTPAQVQKTIERHGLDSTHTSLAIARFCDRESFAAIQLQIGENRSYEEVRDQMAPYFRRDASFALSRFLRR